MMCNEKENVRKDFEYFIKESFMEGQICRELRLSDAEIEQIIRQYPLATYTPTSEKKDGRAWYDVSLNNQ